MFDYGRRIEKEAWRREIYRLASALASDKSRRRERFHWNKEKPQNSQLGALRSVIMTTGEAGTNSGMTDWIDSVRATKNRLDKWPEGSLDYLKNLVNPEARDAIWKCLEWPADIPVLTMGARKKLTQELRATALRSVILACIQCEMRDREKE